MIDERGTMEEFNQRLREVEKLTSKVERNERDIQKTFEVLDKLPMKIMGMILVPTLMLGWQIWMK